MLNRLSLTLLFCVAATFAWAAAPTITVITPSNAIVGAVITITGTDLAAATAVTFNGIAVNTINDNTATALKVTVPERATSGKLIVTTAGGIATSKVDFKVLFGQKNNSKDNAEMVWIPGGTFTMGYADGIGNSNERPAHQVTLSGYWVYQYYVTIAQYLAFCTATDRWMLPRVPKPKDDYHPSEIYASNMSWAGQSDWDDPTLQQHPIVNISWKDAKAYADWAGVTLPTEAQWEYAARGPQGSNYPWGGIASKEDKFNGWDASKCAYWENSGKIGKSTWPVGSFPAGASWCGAQDMAGNVSQWCGDWPGSYDATAVTDPTGSTAGLNRVIRGSSWYSSNESIPSTRRSAKDPTKSDYFTGFRCVSLSPGPSLADTSARPTTPTITTITPPSAVVGTVITITGTNLAGATAVTFNGIAAKNIKGNTTTSLKVTVPEGAASGKLEVTTVAGTVTNTYSIYTLYGVNNNDKDGAEIVWVPGGTTFRESATGTGAGHKVSLSDYWIYKNDVTVAQYRAFCTATKRALPLWPGDKYSWAGKTGWDDPALQQHPIVNVSLNDAQAYADWAGVTLPTVAQWEYAAYGPQVNNYPWGGTATKDDKINGWDTAKCANLYNSSKVGKSTWPVGSFPAGVSWCGAQDMTGNVRQWCGDLGDDSFLTPFTNPSLLVMGNHQLLGGSWASTSYASRRTWRSHYGSDTVRYDFGFRCVSLSPGPAAPKISAVVPLSAAVGTVITITGVNLDKVTAISFNGIAAKTITENTATSLKVTVPDGATSGIISLTTAKVGGTATITTDFMVIKATDGAALVWVPGGTFTMGSPAGVGNADETPEHQVTLSGFWIYKYDVTVAQYRTFCTITGHALPPWPVATDSWAGMTGWDDPALQQHPIVNVSWYDAKSYADWAGVALPSEAQWDYAARGPNGNNFPWGGTATTGDLFNGWDATKCANYYNSKTAGKSTWPVGSFPAGASWCGAQDMLGNVQQWCGDWYGAYTAAAVTDPAGPATGRFPVRRGGSWSMDKGSNRSASRFGGIPASYINGSIGFRCVSLSPLTIAPPRAVVGTVITITGFNLAAATAITFNGIAAKTITDNTANSLKVTVPEGATTGKLVVTTADCSTTSANDFIVLFGVKNNAKDNNTMVWVPEGTFTMGSAAGIGGYTEHPAHQVTLSGYWIYQNDVTVAQYRAFCKATGHALPPWPGYQFSWIYKSGWDDLALQHHPIVNVSWNDAKAYADWAGVTLPTEAQWEYAARGPQGRNFPWGGTATPGNDGNGWKTTKSANWGNSAKVGISTWPVASFPGDVSWCGVQDMAGNVRQWCGDWYRNSAYIVGTVTDPPGPAIGDKRVLRGSSWNGGGNRSAWRDDDGYLPDHIGTNIGFRCVSLPPKAPTIATVAPTITTIVPPNAVIGTVITITGTNLAAVTAVTFNGIVAKTITDNTRTSLKVTVPEGATSGKLTVTTALGTVTNPYDFIVLFGVKNNAKDNATMIWVPGSTFTMGTAADVGSSTDDRPAHQVTLTSFWIYQYDVTVAQYRAFCTATAYKLPKFPDGVYSWKGKTGWDDPELQQHPIVNVSWKDAKAYAEWAGVTLPTEAQWEYVARGWQRNNYPWGGKVLKDDIANGWDETRCAHRYNSKAVGKSTWPVGSFPAGASWCGAQDMAGNVYQWCEDWFGIYAAAPVTDPTGPARGTGRVIRGGSWEMANEYYSNHTASRGSCVSDYTSVCFGFRCASLSPGPSIAYTFNPVIAPTIISITPPNAAVGTVITINGTDLNEATSVTINGIAAKIITDNTKTSLKIKVPEGATTGKLAVTTAGSSVKSVDDFIVLFGVKNNGKDNATMVWVPGGTFTMGSAEDIGSNDESPVHQVTLTGYWVYQYDVTVEQYRAFCTATGYVLPQFPTNYSWAGKTTWADPALRKASLAPHIG